MANCFRTHVLGSFAVMALFSAAAIAAPPQGQDQNKDATPHPLAWAYAVLEAPLPPPPATDETAVKQIPGSTQSFTVKQLRDTGNPVDWFPGDHPPMPSIVAHRLLKTPASPVCLPATSWSNWPTSKMAREELRIRGSETRL